MIIDHQIIKDPILKKQPVTSGMLTGCLLSILLQLNPNFSGIP